MTLNYPIVNMINCVHWTKKKTTSELRSPSINTAVLLLKDPLGMFRNRFVDMSIELKKIDYCVLIFVSITKNFRKTTPNFDQNFRKNYHLSLFFSNFKPAVCLTRK